MKNPIEFLEQRYHEEPVQATNGAAENGWSDVPEQDRSYLQFLAAETNGRLTVNNAVSVAGLALTQFGIINAAVYHDYRAGLGCIFVGRCLDLVDGKVARKLGTWNPLGAKIDAIGDKIAIATATAALTVGGIMPITETVPIVATEVAIATVASIAYKRDGIELPVSRMGKDRMAAISMTVGSTVAAKVIEASGHPQVAEAASAVGYGTLAIAGVLSVPVLRDYMNKGKQLKSRQSAEAVQDA